MKDTEKEYHSALSQCAELLDNMPDGHPITDTPRFLAEKLAAPTIPAQVPAAEVRAQALEEAAKACEAMAIALVTKFDMTHNRAITNCSAAIRSLAQSSTADKATEVRAAEWISVEDRLPEVGQQVIAYRPTAEKTIDPLLTFVRYTGVMRDSWQGVRHGFDCICHPTHWMPMPAIPSTADSGNTDEKGGDHE